MLQDTSNDGKICPIDISVYISLFQKEFSFLLWFDLDIMIADLRRKISSIPEKQPGFHLPEFEA